MKKIIFLTLLIFVIITTNVFAGSEIFEEPHEKSSKNKVIYEQIIFSNQWYSAKRSYEVKTYSAQAKKEKKKDLKKSEKLLSLYIRELASKYKLYFEDIVDIFNEYSKKYYFGIAGDIKKPLVVVRKKMFKKP